MSVIIFLASRASAAVIGASELRVSTSKAIITRSQLLPVSQQLHCHRNSRAQSGLGCPASKRFDDVAVISGIAVMPWAEAMPVAGKNYAAKMIKKSYFLTIARLP